jgi:hypothetical protein
VSDLETTVLPTHREVGRVPAAAAAAAVVVEAGVAGCPKKMHCRRDWIICAASEPLKADEDMYNELSSCCTGMIATAIQRDS